MKGLLPAFLVFTHSHDFPTFFHLPSCPAHGRQRLTRAGSEGLCSARVGSFPRDGWNGSFAVNVPEPAVLLWRLPAAPEFCRSAVARGER